MKVTFTVDLNEDMYTSYTAEMLLKEALWEFIHTREPIEEYMKSRYPDGFLGNHKNDAKKFEQIQERINLANQMRHTIERSPV